MIVAEVALSAAVVVTRTKIMMVVIFINDNDINDDNSNETSHYDHSQIDIIQFLIWPLSFKSY